MFKEKREGAGQIEQRRNHAYSNGGIPM